MAKWLTKKQQEFAGIIKMTEGRSPLVLQMFIDTRPTVNQLQEFNKMMKPIGKKLTRKGYSYNWSDIKKKNVDQMLGLNKNKGLKL